MSNYVVSDTDLSSVANAIRTKGGTSAQLAFPSGFVSAIGDIPTGGQTVYTSTSGLLYTPIMTIDLSIERSNGYTITDAVSKYGSMPYLTELTLTGITRNNSSSAMDVSSGLFSTTKFPLLKKLAIQPTEIRTSTGAVIAEGDSAYNKIKFGHYAFNETNLTELVIGKVGGPFLLSGGYFRNDMPQPPGTNKYQIGSYDGLTFKAYMETYSATGGFSNALAQNTTLTVYNYQTGEVLTA